MTAAKKTISRVAQIWNHRQEVVAWQLRRIAEAVRQEDKDLHRLRTDLEGMIGTFAQEASQRPFLDGHDLDLFFQGASRLIQEGERKKRTLRRLKEEWAAKREVWEEMYRKKKALDILENRLAQQEKLEAFRAEQKHMDDLTLIRRGRR